MTLKRLEITGLPEGKFTINVEIILKHRLTCAWPFDGRLNIVLMPGLDCSPNGPAWTNFENLAYFRLIFGYFLTGKRWASF